MEIVSKKRENDESLNFSDEWLKNKPFRKIAPGTNKKIIFK